MAYVAILHSKEQNDAFVRMSPGGRMFFWVMSPIPPFCVGVVMLFIGYLILRVGDVVGPSLERLARRLFPQSGSGM
jgi:hypothetical protein